MYSLDPHDRASNSDDKVETAFKFEDQKREMAEADVGFDGRDYVYKEYRYDILDDALAYARLDHSRAEYRPGAVGRPQWREPAGPSEPERKQMAELGITFDGKYYRFDEYRYDQLANAIAYVHLRL